MQTTQTVRDFGPSPDRITVTLKTVIDRQGIAITTTAGGSCNSGLSRTFPWSTDRERTLASARTFYGHIRDCAIAGKGGVWQIEAEVGALIEMEQAVDVEQVAEAINAEVDAHHAETIATHNQTVAAVAEVMAGTTQTGGWYGARKATQQTTVPARTVHPTRTRVHCKPPTPAQLDLIRSAHTDADGNLVVTRRPGQSWLMLRAIHRRIGGHRTYLGTSGIITALTYRPEQLAAHLTEELAA